MHLKRLTCRRCICMFQPYFPSTSFFIFEQHRSNLNAFLGSPFGCGGAARRSATAAADAGARAARWGGGGIEEGTRPRQESTHRLRLDDLRVARISLGNRPLARRTSASVLCPAAGQDPGRGTHSPNHQIEALPPALGRGSPRSPTSSQSSGKYMQFFIYHGRAKG